jgi:hypothetical protein
MRRATIQKRRAPGRPTPEPSRELTGVFYRAPGVFAMPVVLSVCLHCKTPRSALRAKRGLCRRCHADLAVRRRYPHAGTTLAALGTESPRGRDRPGDVPPPPDPRPDLEPGPAKVETLAGRYRRRVALFHAREPALPLRALAMPAGSRGPGLRVWRALAAACPDVLHLLNELVGG